MLFSDIFLEKFNQETCTSKLYATTKALAGLLIVHILSYQKICSLKVVLRSQVVCLVTLLNLPQIVHMSFNKLYDHF